MKSQKGSIEWGLLFIITVITVVVFGLGFAIYTGVQNTNARNVACANAGGMIVTMGTSNQGATICVRTDSIISLGVSQ